MPCGTDRPSDARAMDDVGRRAVLPLGDVSQILDFVTFGDVAPHGDGPSPRRDDLLGDRVDPILRSRADDDRGSFAGECHGNRPAETRPAARYDRNLPRELTAHLFHRAFTPTHVDIDSSVV